MKMTDSDSRSVIFMDTNWNAELIKEIKPGDLVNLPWPVRQEFSRRLIRKLIDPDALSVNSEVDERPPTRCSRKVGLSSCGRSTIRRASGGPRQEGLRRDLQRARARQAAARRATVTVTWFGVTLHEFDAASRLPALRRDGALLDAPLSRGRATIIRASGRSPVLCSHCSARHRCRVVFHAFFP